MFVHYNDFKPVFSTCVEVFLRVYEIERERHRFLHVRGGVSQRPTDFISLIAFSPRAWRCFCHVVIRVSSHFVFSTCVEVFLAVRENLPTLASFLHVRGGVSDLFKRYHVKISFSPRAWRCFHKKHELHHIGAVFSTCVEVFPEIDTLFNVNKRFLHVRGGVSDIACQFLACQLFSPRAWRCFSQIYGHQASYTVFSTCVEVFLKSCIRFYSSHRFLHVRGGVSKW